MWDYLTSCNEFNRERGYRDPSDSSSNDNGDRPKKKDGDQGGGNAKGGGSRPKPGAHRTADGGTIMVTPEGKEWVWNGKTTTVVLDSRSNSAVYITVMQGDPDVSLRKTVNGRSYNVADPAYAAAIAAEQAKAGGSKGGAKGGPKVGYRPPTGLAAGGGVATFNAPAQPTPVAGSGAVGTGAGTNRTPARKKRCAEKKNAVGNVLGGTGISRRRPAEATRELIERTSVSSDRMTRQNYFPPRACGRPDNKPFNSGSCARM